MKARVPKHSDSNVSRRISALHEDLSHWCHLRHRTALALRVYSFVVEDNLPFYQAMSPFFDSTRLICVMKQLCCEDLALFKHMSKFLDDFSGIATVNYMTVYNRIDTLLGIVAATLKTWDSGSFDNALAARKQFASLASNVSWLKSKPALDEIYWAGTILPVFWLEHKVNLMFDVDLVDRISDSANDVNTFKCLKEVYADTPVISMQYTSDSLRDGVDFAVNYICFDFEHNMLYAYELTTCCTNYYKIDIGGSVEDALNTAVVYTVYGNSVYDMLSTDYLLGTFKIDMKDNTLTKYGLKYDELHRGERLSTYFKGVCNDMDGMANPLLLRNSEDRHAVGYDIPESVECCNLDRQATKYTVRRMLHSLLYSVSKDVNRYAYFMTPCKDLNETAKEGYIVTQFEYVSKDCPLNKMRQGVDVTSDLKDMVNSYANADYDKQVLPQIYLDSVASFNIMFDGEIEFASSPKEAFSGMQVLQRQDDTRIFRIEFA